MNVPSNASRHLAYAVDAGFSAALMQSVLPGVFVVDRARQIVAFNAVAGQAFGVQPEAILGRPISVLPAPIRALIDESLAGGYSIPTRSIEGPLADSLLNVSTAVAKGEKGEILSVMVEVQDLSAARAIAANLEHLDRLAGLGVVTAGVAHELKNALVAVRTFFDLLTSGENDLDLRAVAAAEVQRVERTVRHLLRGARREECRLVPLGIHILLEDSLNLVRHELQSRRIELDTQLEADTDRIEGDERQLRHTIVNLLMNAVEAMPSGGHLSVETQVVDAWERQHIRITIADTGTGMPPEHLARAFSPFFTTKPEGTGLGLAISRRIITVHNGAVTVESQVGKGTTFNVFLPLL